MVVVEGAVVVLDVAVVVVVDAIAPARVAAPVLAPALAAVAVPASALASSPALSRLIEINHYSNEAPANRLSWQGLCFSAGM